MHTHTHSETKTRVPVHNGRRRFREITHQRLHREIVCSIPVEPPRSTKDCSTCAPCFRSRFDLYTWRRGRASRRRCLRTRNQRNRRRTGGSVHRILGDTRSLDPGSGIARHALSFFFFFFFGFYSLVFLAASPQELDPRFSVMGYRGLDTAVCWQGMEINHGWNFHEGEKNYIGNLSCYGRICLFIFILLFLQCNFSYFRANIFVVHWIFLNMD